MCLVEGEMEIILVPHVFRQEVATGRADNQVFLEYDTIGKEQL